MPDRGYSKILVYLKKKQNIALKNYFTVDVLMRNRYKTYTQRK